MLQYGAIHLFSLVYLTAVVALVIGVQESEDRQPREMRLHVLGCWAKLLGSLVGLGLVVYVIHLLSG